MTKQDLADKLIELHRQTVRDASRVIEALIEYTIAISEEKEDD